MTFEDAKRLVLNGCKVQHISFGKDRYVYLSKDEKFYTEENYPLDWDDFWNIRSENDKFKEGWFLYWDENKELQNNKKYKKNKNKKRTIYL